MTSICGIRLTAVINHRTYPYPSVLLRIKSPLFRNDFQPVAVGVGHKVNPHVGIFVADNAHFFVTFVGPGIVICFENEEMGIYFVTDPNGYWLEVIPENRY